MPWSGSTFYRENEDYQGAVVWQSDAAANILIEAVRHDFHDQDLATGINACLNKSGANTIAANINWGGFRITSLGNGVAATDAANYGQTITAASLDAGTNVLTLTRSVGDVVVDLSALAVGGSTSDFARYSNSSNPFQGSATFEGTVGAYYTLELVDQITATGSTHTWAIIAATPTLLSISNNAGAAFNFAGNAGAASLKINGATVWTDANLPAATFADVLTAAGSYTISGAWAFTNTTTIFNSIQISPFNGLRLVAGTGGILQWDVYRDNTAWYLQRSGSEFLRVPNSGNDFYASGNRVWTAGHMYILTAAPVSGVDGDVAFVKSTAGADKGLWLNEGGTWHQIAS